MSFNCTSKHRVRRVARPGNGLKSKSKLENPRKIQTQRIHLQSSLKYRKSNTIHLLNIQGPSIIQLTNIQPTMSPCPRGWPGGGWRNPVRHQVAGGIREKRSREGIELDGSLL
jgi:hypothetical protein